MQIEDIKFQAKNICYEHEKYIMSLIDTIASLEAKLEDNFHQHHQERITAMGKIIEKREAQIKELLEENKKLRLVNSIIS